MKNGTPTNGQSNGKLPIDELPGWAREQLGSTAAALLPPEMDPDAELLIKRYRFLEDEVSALSERLARGKESEEDDGADAYRPFPVELLPPSLAGYVRASSASLPCAPAMVALPLLSVLSGAVGAAARLRLKRGWKEPSILWTAVVAPSGSAKTAAMDFALRPVYARERHAAEEYEYELAEYEKEVEHSPDLPQPTRRRYRIGDVTREAVAPVLEENPRGVVLVRDELATWIGSFDRYASGAADLHAWLAFYEAKQETVDRVGSGNVTLGSPAVSVTGTIQPGTLKSKLTPLHFDTGFAARLLLTMPPVKPREWTEADITREVEAGYEEILDFLYGVPMETFVGLSPEALPIWRSFYNTANAIAFDMPEGPARSVASKTVGLAARLTLLLHLADLAEEARKGGRAPSEIDWDEETVTPDTVRRAAKLATWLRDETLRVYRVLGLTAQAVPPIMRFLQSLPDEFRTSEAKEIAEKEEIPKRTMYKWLEKLQERGEIEKIRRGLYRKTYV